jgi:hypothetical protein
MMHPDEDLRQRYFAYCCRYSWGWNKEHVAHRDGKGTATQREIADYLNVNPKHLNDIHVALVRDGWIVRHASQIIPNPAPPERPADEKPPEPQDLYPGLPSREDFRALEDPALETDWKRALEKWSDVRKRARAIDKKYDEMVQAQANRRTDGTTDTAAETESVVQPEKRLVQPEKSPVQRSLSKEQRTKNKPSSLDDEAAVIASALQLDDDAAHKLLRDTRKESPGIEIEVIVELSRMKLTQAGERARNWVGLLLASVPKMASGATLATARANVRSPGLRDGIARPMDAAPPHAIFDSEPEDSGSDWAKIRAHIKQKIQLIPYKNWLAASAMIGDTEDGELRVRVPDETTALFIEADFGNDIRAAIAELELSVTRVEFVWPATKSRAAEGGN